MDWNSEEGKKLAERLRKEQVIWLTTVRPNGMPAPTPVWFVWEGDSVLFYTQPGSLKIKNLAANPQAALNLNSDEWGGSLVIFTGQVERVNSEPPAYQNAAYLEKYGGGIQDLKMTPESFSQDYSVALRFHIQHTRVE